MGLRKQVNQDDLPFMREQGCDGRKANLGGEGMKYKFASITRIYTRRKREKRIKEERRIKGVKL